jgi:hypothetical protein
MSMAWQIRTGIAAIVVMVGMASGISSAHELLDDDDAAASVALEHGGDADERDPGRWPPSGYPSKY